MFVFPLVEIKIKKVCIFCRRVHKLTLILTLILTIIYLGAIIA